MKQSSWNMEVFLFFIIFFGNLGLGLEYSDKIKFMEWELSSQKNSPFETKERLTELKGDTYL